MNPHLRPLFVILVHYGDPVITDQSLATLSQSTAQAADIIVIDQAEVAYTAPIGVKAVIIRPKTNGGYGAAINTGLGVLLSRAKESDLVVVMNNDVLVEKDTLALLQTWQEANNQPSLCGTAIMEDNELLSGGGYWSPWTGRTTLLKAKNTHNKPNYIHGAFMAASYATWLKLKGVPEKYFMYWEDVLLSARARRLVYHCISDILVCGISVKQNESPTKTYYLVRNGADFLERETSWPVRYFWFIKNRLRLIWRYWRSGHNNTVYQALLDAKNKVTGPKKL